MESVVTFIVCDPNGQILWTGKAPTLQAALLQKAEDRRVVVTENDPGFIDDGRLVVNFNTMLTTRRELVEGEVSGEGLQVIELFEEPS